MTKGISYFVRTSLSDLHCICEGPFASVHDAWMHEYANNVLDASRSDSRKGVLARKDGRHSFIQRSDDLDMDIHGESVFREGRVYEKRPVSSVKYPEFWPVGEASYVS